MCIRALAGATEVIFLADLTEFIFYCVAFLLFHCIWKSTGSLIILTKSRVTNIMIIIISCVKCQWNSADYLLYHFYYECMSYIHVYSSACWCNRGYFLSRFNGVYFLLCSISSVPLHMEINRIIDHIDKIKSNKHYDNHNIVCQMPMEFSWLPPLSFQNVVSPTRMNSKDRLHSW